VRTTRSVSPTAHPPGFGYLRCSAQDRMRAGLTDKGHGLSARRPEESFRTAKNSGPPAGSARVRRTWTILAGGRELIYLDDCEACRSGTKSREAVPSITGSVGHHVCGPHCYGPGMEDSHLAPLYEEGCQGPLDADAFRRGRFQWCGAVPGRRPFMVILKAGSVEGAVREVAHPNSRRARSGRPPCLPRARQNLCRERACVGGGQR
jgi:hypothetical protein